MWSKKLIDALFWHWRTRLLAGSHVFSDLFAAIAVWIWFNPVLPPKRKPSVKTVLSFVSACFNPTIGGQNGHVVVWPPICHVGRQTAKFLFGGQFAVWRPICFCFCPFGIFKTLFYDCLFSIHNNQYSTIPCLPVLSRRNVIDRRYIITISTTLLPTGNSLTNNAISYSKQQRSTSLGLLLD